MKPSKQQGFSLLEVLVAFAILALSVGILLKIFSGGANTAVLAEEYTTAVQIAEAQMAKVGTEIALKESESSGQEDGKYSWQVSISPYLFDATELDPDTLTTRLLKVNVWVSWGDEGREVHLSTLKIFTATTTDETQANDSDDKR